ncbi:MAG: glucose-1-phosphate adenylyltransferase subunit GlgD [Caldilinea sp.]|nr:glucose-1-phosphate adenylyltransferase subunit GlgD [Caldilinea sp.]MCB9119831.1 glucose-1-phosphate adenylyltransferase subunit GlgD [Caldilineaceae bacterium]MCB9124475.1 glucose-1-phosphate adenylyltransferase subunit GlgD [Caldilineaceae bacterium]MCW5841068.1 glucose-1-phosphate adenylyltransferase subunit GlgD [Caldilinea sp.]
MIMAGGFSERLSVLTETRAEPAVPFGGKFRLIDFPLSNCVNSGIFNIAVLTQYKPRSLNDHIGIGKPWDLDRAQGGVRLLQPYQGGPYGDWQKGTADAVRRNLDFVLQQQEEHVLILAGDHIYLMNYQPMLREHVSSGADLTVAVRRVNPHETHRYGIVTLGADDRIVGFQEKPRRARETLASMGIYVFRKDALVETLQSHDYLDFGKDVVPALIAQGKDVRAHAFPGYWADVGTVQAYWEANMSLLAEEPALNLYDPDWVVHTRSEERAPAKLGANAQVGGSLISNGCWVEGIVERSVLAPGVRVAEGAVIRDSVILPDTVIESGAVIDRCVVDKRVRIGAGAKVGDGDDNTANKAMPEVLNTGLTMVGEGSTIPEGLTVGRNVVIHPDSTEKTFGKKKKIASGSDIGVDLH